MQNAHKLISHVSMFLKLNLKSAVFSFTFVCLSLCTRWLRNMKINRYAIPQFVYFISAELCCLESRLSNNFHYCYDQQMFEFIIKMHWSIVDISISYDKITVWFPGRKYSQKCMLPWYIRIWILYLFSICAILFAIFTCYVITLNANAIEWDSGLLLI